MRLKTLSLLLLAVIVGALALARRGVNLLQDPARVPMSTGAL
jgi:hypothetical protein